MPDPLYGFCRTDIWDEDLTWYSKYPDFTPCFQNTVLVWVPFGVLLLLLPHEIYTLRKSKESAISWNFYNTLKMVTTVVLFGLTLAELIFIATSYQNEFTTAANISSVAIKLACYALVFLLKISERNNGIQSSPILFFFWFLHLLASTVTYYSRIINLFEKPELHDLTIFGFGLATLPLIFLEFALLFIADNLPKSRYHTVEENICPENSSSYFSYLIFDWISPLIVAGYKKPVIQQKLWGLDSPITSENIVGEFDHYWDKEMKKAKDSGWEVTATQESENNKLYRPSFLWALFKCYWPSVLNAMFQKTISDLVSFLSPLILNLIITHVSTNDPMWKGIFYAIALFITAELQSLFLGHYFFNMNIVGMKVRMALISNIYRKALKISNKERQNSTVGEIVNLMSIDTQRFVDLSPYILMIYSAPLQIALSLYLLYQEIGVSVVSGVIVMILLGPFNAVIATVTRKLQIKDMKFKDERTKVMNELLNGIKVLKLYAWELPFAGIVKGIRFKELQVLKKMTYFMAGISFIWTCAPFLVSLASFATFVLIDDKNILTANIAFVSLSLFNLLRFPMNMLPSLITALIQTGVAVKRLNKFFRGEELDPKAITNLNFGENAIDVENGTFEWGSQDQKPALSDINLSVRKGQLVAVVGTVGCGKSSLISSILGELHMKSGKINVQGSIAYVPQQAWIQNSSVKNNILMYKSLRPLYYDKVLDACALKSDLAILPGGDETEIGEKGINLSGGQKQRVSLARAVYHNSDIYMLDDPLSAVDSHVGKHIFESVIGPSGMLRSKTRVFVTNSITYLPKCDSIVVLKDGVISETGTYTELLNSRGVFSEFLTQYLSNEDQNIDDEDLQQLDDILTKVPVPSDLYKKISKHITDSESESFHSKSTDVQSKRSRRSSKVSEMSTSKKQKTKLTQEEVMETAEVKLSVYISYLKRLGYTTGFMIVFLWTASQAASVGSNVWLSEWSSDPLPVDGVVDKNLRDLRLGIYGALGMVQAVTVMLGSFLMANGTIKAANHLHNIMLDCVLRSPLSFFDVTPIGRIVNRFSKDVNVMDVSLVNNFRGWLMTFLQVMSVIIVDAIETPLILLVLAPATFLYYFIQRIYIASSRQLKRLESVTRSPIYVHFSESITGASSIRAYGMQDTFIKESNNKVDTNMICYYPSVAANRWLAIRLEFVGNLVVLFAALFAVLSRDVLDPGSVGLSVSYAMSITGSLNWMVRMSSELETNIVSVERILEYSSLEPEADWNNDYNSSKSNWPENGEISFNSYAVRYREGMDLVLRGIDCDIKSGEKIGVCGRTGAGKSSMTLALFRIIEAAKGSITIDDVDISKIGLHDLRSRLTIIPQDPVLFSGTLRQNLDPFEKKSDKEIWSSLEHAHLKNFVQDLNEGLEHKISEGGENLSVGQRQLVCLARALLRKTKILILDEATAAVDLETDDLIQETIRKEFSDCTILTIAHRLNTIMDSSRILVLNQGEIAEFDTPEELLKNKSTIFYGMAVDAGLI